MTNNEVNLYYYQALNALKLARIYGDYDEKEVEHRLSKYLVFEDLAISNTECRVNFVYSGLEMYVYKENNRWLLGNDVEHFDASTETESTFCAHSMFCNDITVEREYYMVIAGFTDSERNNLEVIDYNLSKAEADECIENLAKESEEYRIEQDDEDCDLFDHEPKLVKQKEKI